MAKQPDIHLPLFRFFEAWRDQGSKIGLEEYFSLLHALSGAYGFTEDSHQNLFQLCKLLWLNPGDSIIQFKHLFGQFYGLERKEAMRLGEEEEGEEAPKKEEEKKSKIDGELEEVGTKGKSVARTAKDWIAKDLKDAERIDILDKPLQKSAGKSAPRMVLLGKKKKQEDGPVKLWDLEGRLVQTFVGHSDMINSVAFSPDGQSILTGCEDHTAKLWDLNGQELQTFQGHEDAVSSVAFSPDGQTILTGSDDGTAKLWNLNGQEIRTFPGQAPIFSVAFSPDKKTILTGRRDAIAKLWDLNGKELQIFNGHKHVVSSVAFSPDGQHLLTGSYDDTAKLWNQNGQEIQTFVGHQHNVNSVSFSPDGRQVLTGSGDQTAKLWNLNGQELQTFEEDMGGKYVAFSPSGKLILVASTNVTTARLVDLSGQVIQAFDHKSDIFSVAFSPDGQHILTGGDMPSQDSPEKVIEDHDETLEMVRQQFRFVPQPFPRESNPRIIRLVIRNLFVASGKRPSKEVNIVPTIEQMAKDGGKLLHLVYQQMNTYTAKLLVLVDVGSEMVAFRKLTDNFLELIEHELDEPLEVLYFSRVLGRNLYRNKSRTDRLPLRKLERQSAFRNVPILVISDAGAATGEADRDEILKTEAVLQRLKILSSRVAWLNPLPEHRWESPAKSNAWYLRQRGTAMYDMTHSGIKLAVDVLRGMRSANAKPQST